MMRRLQSWLAHLFAREGFRGPVLTLLSGSAVALAVSYLASPLLTRLYTPEAFGVADYFVMLLSILVNVASLRYEDALMVPERDEEAAGVLGLAAVLTTLFSLALALAAWTEPAHRLLAALGVEALQPWLWLLGPALFFMRVSKLLEFWLTRRKQFRLVTAGDAANRITTTGTRVAAGLGGAGAGGLIGGFAVAQVVSALFYLRAVGRAGGVLRGLFDRRQMRSHARRFVRFPLFTMPATVLNALVTRLPTALLPWFFTLDAVGHFGRAFTALAVPLGFIGNAVAQVFFVHAAEAHRAGTLARLAGTVHARLVMLGLFPTLALVLAGPDLFAFIFGEPWRVAGLYARFVAVWLFLASVASPLTRLFDVLERQRTDLVLSIVMFAAQAGALVAGGLSGDVLYTIALASAAGAAVRVLHLGVMLRLAGVRLREALAPYLRYTLISLPGLALVALVLPAEEPWLTTAATAAGGALYAGWVVWKDRLLARRP